MKTRAQPDGIASENLATNSVARPATPTCPKCGCPVHPQPRTREVVCTVCGEKRWPLAVLQPEAYVCARCRVTSPEKRPGGPGRREEVGGVTPEAGCALISVRWRPGFTRARSPPSPPWS